MCAEKENLNHLIWIRVVAAILFLLVLITGCANQPGPTKTLEVEKMAKKVLFIIAQQNYQDHEYGAPKQILEDAGIKVVTASKKAGNCRGAFGDTVTADLALSEVKVSDYDAIIFIGGAGAVQYQQDSQAHSIAKEALNQNKVLGAICIAPTTLAYAGVLNGKKATVWNGDNNQSKILINNGANFVNKPVVVDGKIVTANGPPAAEEFGRKLLELLK